MATLREKEYEVTVLVRQKVRAKGISEEDALWRLNNCIESGQTYEPVPGNTHLTQIEKIRCVDAETACGGFYISKEVIALYNSYMKQRPYGKKGIIFSHTHVFRDGNMMTVQLNAPSEKKKAELSDARNWQAKSSFPKRLMVNTGLFFRILARNIFLQSYRVKKYCVYKKDGLILRRRLIRKVWIVWKKYLIRRQ